MAIDGRAPGCSPRTPGPEAAEGRAVPAHDGSRLDDDEDVAPAGPRTRERDPEEPVGPVERRARAATLKNGQLLAEGEILQGERAASSKRRPGCGKHGDQEREHAPDLSVPATLHEPTNRQRSRVDRILANDKSRRGTSPPAPRNALVSC
jgi:hypothetical protein